MTNCGSKFWMDNPTQTLALMISGNFSSIWVLTNEFKGSHHVYRKEAVEEKPNLQRDGSKTKKYQVQQIRNILRKYNL